MNIILNNDNLLSYKWRKFVFDEVSEVKIKG